MDIREPHPLTREAAEPAAGSRPWIGVRFSCGGDYLRVFREPGGQGYLARCPRCAAMQRFIVGHGGTSHRFFEVSCRG